MEGNLKEPIKTHVGPDRVTEGRKEAGLKLRKPSFRTKAWVDLNQNYLAKTTMHT